MLGYGGEVITSVGDRVASAYLLGRVARHRAQSLSDRRRKPIDRIRSEMGLKLSRVLQGLCRPWATLVTISTSERLSGVVRAFDEFNADAAPRLRRALVAAYGPHVGADAVAAALAYGWEHWPRVGAMVNPIGYLYRVGQSTARRELRVQPSMPIPPDASIPDVEPSLIARLNELTEAQRVCVLLVHAYQWRQQEVADLLEIDHSTVRTHVARALERLRSNLEADHAT